MRTLPPFYDYARYFALSCVLLAVSCCPTLVIGLAFLTQFTDLSSLGTIIIWGAVAGIIVTGASIVLLPQQPLKNVRWFLLNIAGMIISVASYLFTLTLMPNPRVEGSISLQILLAVVCVIALTGLPLGFAQWIYLRKHVAFAYRWILALNACWGIGGTLYIFYVWVITND
jgi:hypothetical protein